MQRDFTYIDDIVEGIVRIQNVIPQKNESEASDNPATSKAPYRIYNIGNNNPVQLTTFIDAIEKACGKEAEKILMPMQKGDVPRTYADIDALVEATGIHLRWIFIMGLRGLWSGIRTTFRMNSSS